MDYFQSRRWLDTLPDWEIGPVELGPLENYLPRTRAMLEAVGNPQEKFPSVIIGGTNGKGTVASLLADLVAACGHTVGLYTSPHLHTLRERVRVNGQMPGKDSWASATRLLYDRTREFGEQGLGGFSKYEAMTVVAAHLFAEGEVDFSIFEVGLGGRYDATNAWDSEIAVLTSIALDHTDVLGDTLLQIAAEKVEIARPGRPLITTGSQQPEVLRFIRDEASARGVELLVAGCESVDRVDCTRSPGASVPYSGGVPAAGGRPRSHGENARLAVAAAQRLLGDRLTAAIARETIEQHSWYGRFELVAETPPLILDGAHNPAAVEDLVAKLAELAARWHFVVGVNGGHDPAGILKPLGSIAETITLTSSAHPKAIDVEVLLDAAPSGTAVETEPACRLALQRSLERSLDRQHPDKGLCVLGSLHLVARAREFFDLPHEREGISEDVALESLECVEIACARGGIDCERVTDNDNVLRVDCGRRAPFYFMRNKHPFNDYVAARLAEDKGYQHELFSQAGLPVPRTLQVFNPLADARFDRYKTHRSVREIAKQVDREFSFPLLIKKYRSSVSQGVYLERNALALKRRLDDLFEHSAFADNVVLIQSFVEGPEYRLVGSRDRLLLAYRKQSDEVLGHSDLNPLHHSSGRAEKVTDEVLLDEMGTLLRKVTAVVELGFFAVDLIRGASGCHILEINPNPFCYFYNRDNGREDFVGIYEELLREFVGPRIQT